MSRPDDTLSKFGKFRIFLPTRFDNEQAQPYKDNKPLVIIGANGSGKSRIGAFIESTCMGGQIVQRLSAQRALKIPTIAPVKTEEGALNLLLWGTENSSSCNYQTKSNRKFGGNVFAAIQDDFEQALSSLFAQENGRNARYVTEAKTQLQRGDLIPKLTIPDSPIDVLLKLWSELMPHRPLNLSDGKVMAIKNGGDCFHASEMSDGERAALYLVTQCLCVPKDSVIVIDEPEIHLHRALMSRFWDRLESVRNDCLFIYITHDLSFATSRKDANKLWVKSFRPSITWEWEFIEGSEFLPESLVLEILGSRQATLFVEGTEDGLDATIYSLIYPHHHVIARGGCSKVIESVKAFQGTRCLHDRDVFGIIDRDFRPEVELTALRKRRVLTIEVAEIENLLCLPELIEAISSELGRCKEDDRSRAEKIIISRLSKEADQQAAMMTASELRHRLSMFNQALDNLSALHAELARVTATLEINKVYSKNQQKITEAQISGNCSSILKIYNQKNLISEIAKSIFGINKEDYKRIAIRLLKSGKDCNSIRAAIAKHCPSLNT